jgi:hypothetical protein
MKKQPKKKTIAAKSAAKPDPDDSIFATMDETYDWAKFLFGDPPILPGTVCPACASASAEVDLLESRQWTCLNCGASGRLIIEQWVARVPKEKPKASQPAEGK